MAERSFFPGLEELTERDQFVLFYEQQIVVQGDKFIWSFSEIESVHSDAVEMHWVDEHNGASVIAINITIDPRTALEAEGRPLRSLLALDDERALGMAGKANQILDWYASHRYCGSCGNPTEPHPSQRVLTCSVCSRQYFPRINPCAIMLVVRNDEILLARHTRFKSGFYSCLAGFIEIGETPEQTVAREVMEEVNIEVANIRYAKSQSWPFPSQLMLGFYADYQSGEIIPEESEIEEAAWFNVNELPPVPASSISVAGQLIEDYVQDRIHRRFAK